MQLTRFTDLGLRVLMYLATAPHDTPVTIQQIAERFTLSHSHLMKVVHFMGQQGWLSTTRGKGGGLKLAYPAEQLNLGAIVRALEPAAPLIDCAEPPCALAGACQLKHVLDEALDAFYLVLDGYSLAELLTPETRAGIIRLLPV